MHHSSFALLDDCEAHASAPSSRLYTDFAVDHRCSAPAELDGMWSRIEPEMRSGLHAVVLADYEWGAELHGLRAPAHSARRGGLRVLLFRRLQLLGREDAGRWLQAQDGDRELASPAGFTSLQSSLTAGEFHGAIERILELLRAGDAYQINFTYRLDGQAFGSPQALYRRLRQRQPVQFGALIALPNLPNLPGTTPADSEWILSCSPELLARCRDGRVTARPMKGTSARHLDPRSDTLAAEWLAADEKNRAENLMIVDLLRNDLGRIAATGSVQVPRLFAVESYPTVHQMVSTIEATLRPDVGFPEVLRALFPCGSITGAPKHRAMELIGALESTPRQLYTGAIGWVEGAAAEAGKACGDFCLSVAIRTALLGPETGGMRTVRIGVGGGIVLDSTPEAEWQETKLKAGFAVGLDPGFALFETLHATPTRGIRRLDLHLARLKRSALHLGFTIDMAGTRALLDATVARLPAGSGHRVRLELAHNGEVGIATSPLTAPAPRAFLLVAPAPRAFYLTAREPLPAAERALVGHKTTHRATYDAALREAEAVGALDVLFFNERGELTEGARSNIFLRLDGVWCTPPLNCGLLPGTMRERVLRRTPAVRERVLGRRDLSRAEAVVLCNGLRGLTRVVRHPSEGP